jgi:cerevisin
MACPHVAGWVAYVMEIYGTETLPYKTQKELNELTILGDGLPTPAELALEESESSDLMNQVVSSAGKSFIPQWVLSAFTHSVVAPTPKPKDPVSTRLTPLQIKGLIKKLATKDILGNMPADTPNILLYNNATTIAKSFK